VDETRVGFGTWLRRSRKALDLTQAELANAVGCSTITLRKIESEERRPSELLARRLAERLAVPADRLPAFMRFARGDPWAGPSPPGLDSLPVLPRAGRFPAPLTTLIGRQAEVTEVTRLLAQDGTRLLTLTGPPGVGKTRLSLQVAAELERERVFADGARFVALAALTAPDQVVPAVAQALGLRDLGHRSLLDQIKSDLYPRRLLLVLDNFEQVTEAAPALPELLQACPDLKLLATSRERLRVYGERLFGLRPLPTPELDPLPPLEALPNYSAIALFVERARALRPAFALTADNAAQVAAICRHVNGLPLALELLAAHLATLSPRELLDRLSGPAAGAFALRADGLRGLPPRHRRLLDAIGWSYERLPAAEQLLLARLGVFAGGFEQAAATAVCGGPPAPAEAVTAGLAALRAKNLVADEAGAGEQRCYLLEAIRHFALERLQAGGEADVLRQRHLDYFAQLAQAGQPHLTGPGQAGWLDRLEREHANLRAALKYALDSGQPARALEIAVAIWRFWHVHGHLAEGRAWLEQALAAAPPGAVPMARRASALNAAASLAGSQHQFDVARQYLEASLALRRELDDQTGIMNSLNNLGLAARNLGDYAGAMRLHHESLALARALGNVPAEARCLNNLGLVALSQGDALGARGYLEAALALHRQIDNIHAIASSLQALGESQALLEAVPEAARAFRESLALLQRLKDWVGLAACLNGLAWAAARQDQPERAARLIGAAEQLRARIASPPLEIERRVQALAMAAIQDRLAPRALARALADGRALTPEQALAEALGGEPGAL
jgi:predicted ATPase/DNA-binding XRE family transcriptional regulator